jgi:hypothetical protein
VVQGISVSAGQSAADRPGWTRWSTCSQSLALFWPFQSVRDAAVLRPFTAQLIRRKLAWPFAAGTPVTSVILLIIGVVGDRAVIAEVARRPRVAGVAVDTVRAPAPPAPPVRPAPLTQEASVNEAAMSSRPRVNAGEVLGHAVE